jgi:hypothetical protein
MARTPIHHNTIKRLDELHNHIQRYGVGLWEHDQSREWYKRRKPIVGSHAIIRRYARAMAKDMRRPFIWAEYGPSQAYDYKAQTYVDVWRAWITVKPTTRTQPVFAALIMGATDLVSTRDSAPLSISKNKTVWYFCFTGDDGKFLFEHWLKQCRTNKKFRAALSARNPRR